MESAKEEGEILRLNLKRRSALKKAPGQHRLNCFWSQKPRSGPAGSLSTSSASVGASACLTDLGEEEVVGQNLMLLVVQRCRHHPPQMGKAKPSGRQRAKGGKRWKRDDKRKQHRFLWSEDGCPRGADCKR